MKKLAMNLIMFCTIAFLAMPSSLYAQGLVSPADLKSWIDAGYIDNLGRKVVILDTGFDVISEDPLIVDNRHTYDAGHIPGAYYVSPLILLIEERTDGPIKVRFMVPSGAMMDDQIVQKWGIDKNTAVVFTGNTMWATTRYYWTFRYWGFKKSQLFILNGKANGGQSVWEDDGYVLETDEPPQPTPSTFSVCEWPGNMDAVRASTEEFFMAADGAIPNTIVVDARPVEDWNADIDNLSEFNKNDIFAFRIKNSIWIEWSEFLVGGASEKHVFKSEQDIVAMLQARGITEGMVPYSFSQVGGKATVSFFVFDAILDRPAKIHDGSSIELGNLGYLNVPEGPDKGLPEDSPWRFDRDKYCSIITYNDPSIAEQPPIDDAYAPSANYVNEEDKDYYCDVGTFCRGLADFDQDVDSFDLTEFLKHFGRGKYVNPCPPDGPAPVPKTGQTHNYHRTDDGYWKRGVEYPRPRFVPATPLVFVRDRLTGLNWIMVPQENLTWRQAVDYCRELPLGGLWRLPNIKEMMSLWDYGYTNPALCDALGANHHTQSNPFTLPGTQYYWTSTTYKPDPIRAWYCNSNNGSLGYQDKNIEMVAWCVTDGHVSSPAPRFTDNQNGTVTDNDSGLVWLKDANCFGSQDWYDAMAAATALVSGTCGLSDGSNAGDWRLPTKEEWEAFVCTEYSNPAVCNTEGTGRWTEDNPFNHIQFVCPLCTYWSSTTYVSNSNKSWFVYIDDGNVFFDDKFTVSYVWPVR